MSPKGSKSRLYKTIQDWVSSQILSREYFTLVCCLGLRRPRLAKTPFGGLAKKRPFIDRTKKCRKIFTPMAKIITRLNFCRKISDGRDGDGLAGVGHRRQRERHERVVGLHLHEAGHPAKEKTGWGYFSLKDFRWGSIRSQCYKHFLTEILTKFERHTLEWKDSIIIVSWLL